MRELIPATCQFGCKRNIKSKDIKDHEEICDKRPLLNCADLDCQGKMQLKKLIHHIETCHPNIIKQDQESESAVYNLDLGTTVLQDDSRRWQWPALRLKSNLDYFFLEAVKEIGGSWIVWLYYSGFAQDAANYTCSINVHHPDHKRVSVTYSGDVISMTVDQKTIEKERMGLIFSNYAVKQLVCGNKLASYITISKK
jgi:hypothetical protein